MALAARLKREFVSGWKPFEVVWLALFYHCANLDYVQTPDSWLAMISGISGIFVCVLVSKVKLSNGFFS